MSVTADRSVVRYPNFGCVGHGADNPNGDAFIEQPATSLPSIWTRSQFDAMCDAVARTLDAHGIGAGDRVCLAGPNSVHYLAIMLGTMRVGAAAVPLNVKLPGDVQIEIVRRSGAKVVFTDTPTHWERSANDHGVEWVAPLAGSGFEGLLNHGRFDAVEPAPDAPALQLYTSGSTGLPKGVVISHQAKAWAIESYTPPVSASGIRAVVAGPLYHKNALLMTLVAYSAGGTVALLPRFDAREYLHAIAAQRISILSGVPTMFAMLLDEADLLADLDLSSVVMIFIGSAPLTDSLLIRVQDVFPNAHISNNYGTTEVAAIFGGHPDGLSRPVGSLGYPLAGTEARLVGGDDPDHGVLEVRNPSVMLGYDGQPELTEECLVDGWYHTGDVMRRDESGFYLFVGRSDDMFVCGGENIYPSQVESLLERHPSVQAVGVVPIADTRKGAVPVAFVVTSNQQLNPNDVKRFALDNGPAYAHPRHVFTIDELPLSSTNKVDKRALQREAQARVFARNQPGSSASSH